MHELVRPHDAFRPQAFLQRMDIVIEPLKTDDVDTFTEIYWDAFNPLDANMILPMIYPLGFQPDLRERLRNRVLKSMRDDSNSNCFCARDTATGDMLGVSWWANVQTPSQNRDELDECYQEAKETRSGGIAVEGMDHRLEDAFFKAAFYSEAESMGSAPYMTLKLLAVRPDYARKGIGTRLLEHGLASVDRLGLPAFIHAGVQAKPLYERYGFQNVGDMPCNALEYGARSDGRHWCLVRPPCGHLERDSAE